VPRTRDEIDTHLHLFIYPPTRVRLVEVEPRAPPPLIPRGNFTFLTYEPKRAFRPRRGRIGAKSARAKGKGGGTRHGGHLMALAGGEEVAGPD